MKRNEAIKVGKQILDLFDLGGKILSLVKLVLLILVMLYVGRAEMYLNKLNNDIIQLKSTIQKEYKSAKKTVKTDVKKAEEYLKEKLKNEN